jgi:hypothetical protein
MLFDHFASNFYSENIDGGGLLNINTRVPISAKMTTKG